MMLQGTIISDVNPMGGFIASFHVSQLISISCGGMYVSSRVINVGGLLSDRKEPTCPSR